jgi:hypothetical protein
MPKSSKHKFKGESSLYCVVTFALQNNFVIASFLEERCKRVRTQDIHVIFHEIHLSVVGQSTLKNDKSVWKADQSIRTRGNRIKIKQLAAKLTCPKDLSNPSFFSNSLRIILEKTSGIVQLFISMRLIK